MSERKWTKGPVAVLVALDKHIKAERSLLYEASAREGEAASSIVIDLYDALNQLANASEYFVNRVVETKGVRCVDDTEAAIKLARAALQRAEGEGE